MTNRVACDVSFGSGKWLAKRTLVDGCAIYGVCSSSSRFDSDEQDSICLSPSTDAQAFSTVTLLIRPDWRANVPYHVDQVSYRFSRGDWSKDVENDPTFDDIFPMPLPGGGVVYTMEDPRFQPALFDALDKFGRDAQLRIGVLRHFGNRLDDRSHFAFFDLDGFWPAWRALRTLKHGAYEMLLRPSDLGHQG